MQLINAFERFYQQVTIESIDQLDQIYAIDAKLVDPIGEHQGLAEIQQYFRKLLLNTSKCHCVIQHICEQQNEIFLSWQMTIAHPSLNSGNDVVVNGVSHIKVIDDKVSFHRDYYDLGEMIYEHVPIFKHLVKMIKNRINQ